MSAVERRKPFLEEGSSPSLALPIPAAPAGLKAMYTACQGIYPDQPNPLQVTSVMKYWLGGPDPLDYVSMYHNAGDHIKGVPRHWHYISFGLSDLHGDARVHSTSRPNQPSGYGFELTFRLKIDSSNSSSPPLWPATLLQSLARYIFNSGNTFCVGDFVPWKGSLDGSSSQMCDMIIAADPQLEPMSTDFGTVGFLQVVGVLSDEIKAVQWWRGQGMIDIMKAVPQAGGEWLVTDMNRSEAIFDLDISLREKLNDGILRDGSNLSGVSGRLCWMDPKVKGQQVPGISSELPALLNSSLGKSFSHGEVTSHDSVHITLDLDSARLLHLAIKGRLKHGRHFTFKNVMNDSAVTLVTSSVEGSFATPEDYLASMGSWLQILLDENFMEDVLDRCGDISRLRPDDLPYTLLWLSRGLSLTVVNG